MRFLRDNPRNQSLLLCFVTFLVGVGFIASYLRWDIPAEVARNRVRVTPPAQPAPPPSPSPSPPTPGAVIAVPSPQAPVEDVRAKAALLQSMMAAYTALQTLEADILTPGPDGELTVRGHFFMMKPAGQDSTEQIKLRVRYTAVPITEVLVDKETVHAIQPTRRVAITMSAEAATEAWLKDYLELMQNIDVTLLAAGDAGSGKRAELAIVPRQPQNVRKAVIAVDLATYLPVRFDVEFPLRRQIVAFDKVTVGRPIDPAVFRLRLPSGMQWTSR